MIELFLISGISFLVALISFPYFIKKLEENGIVVRDRYKKGNKMVPTEGGIIVIFIYLLIISILSLIGYEFNFIPILVLAMFAIFGVLDDLIGLRHAYKIIFPALFAVPLISLIRDTSIALPFSSWNFGALYPYLIMPIYIMVAANLVNMHSGFNGVASGTGLLVLASLVLKSFMGSSINNVLFIFPFMGIVLAFLYYNFYPAKIFEGDVGSFMLGAAIGIVIILQKLEFVGFVMLIPHTVNFLMYVYWKSKRILHTKFGKIREDGTLEVPNPLTLKWVLPYYFRATERQALFFCYALTALFSVVGLLI